MTGCHAAVRSAGVLVLCALAAVGCRSVYYAANEVIGVEKRHLLRRNVEKVQEEQTEASEEFRDVLTQIKDLYGYDGGDLEKVYRRLSGDYDDCEARAESVRSRMQTVERIARDMFSEWEAEIDMISTPALKSRSETALRNTRRRYDALADAMAQAESRMGPALRKLNDYVLALKHELNAQAIGALQGEVSSIETEVLRLLDDMNRSIREADSFLAELK